MGKTKWSSDVSVIEELSTIQYEIPAISSMGRGKNAKVNVACSKNRGDCSSGPVGIPPKTYVLVKNFGGIKDTPRLCKDLEL